MQPEVAIRVVSTQTTLSTGQAFDLYDLMETREELRVHQLAMAETALPAAEWVTAHIPVLKREGKVLDVGGSHGLYSAAICRQNPPLRAEVMELPGVIDVAQSVAHELGTADLVRHIEGDIRNAHAYQECAREVPGLTGLADQGETRKGDCESVKSGGPGALNK